MPRRLAHKLILSLTLIVVIVAAFTGFINTKTQERQLLGAVIQGADQLSKGITAATWQAMLADRRSAAYEVMKTIAERQGIDRITIFNREGRLMFSTNAGESRRQVDKSAEVCSVCHATNQPLVELDVPPRVRIFQRAGGGRVLGMVTPIYNEPSCSQAACHAHPERMKVLGVLDVNINIDEVDREVAEVKYRVMLVSAVEIVLIAIFIALFTGRFVTAPIRQLIAGTKAVSEMHLDRPVEVREGSVELDELAASFNVMRERLGTAVSEINRSAVELESKVEKRTEQLKAAQQKLMQSDRLASLGQLAASVAHEINNPISGVLNLSMLMQRILRDDGVPPDRLADFRRYLGQISSETARVGRIVSDLLSFSRRSRPQRGEADLNKIVRTTLSLVSHKLKLAGVEAVLDLEESMPAVLCDSSQIQQVVLNLVLNGAEATYSRGGGRIRVATRSSPGSQGVLLEVADNGEGIPPENLARIFDPFFTTKGDGKGVGLGLAVSYGIVHAHGGEIEVHSRPGEGTRFTVTLPLAAQAVAANPAQAS